MAAALLLLVLSWSPVTTDCLGGPERLDHYEVRWAEWGCVGVDTDAPFCVFHLEQLDTALESVTVPADIDPPPGSGWWFEVVAVDRAGNRSDHPCPS